ncbi:hypothetical protein AOLI_G00277600 [Acnodon oligacanthus]
MKTFLPTFRLRVRSARLLLPLLSGSFCSVRCCRCSLFFVVVVLFIPTLVSPWNFSHGCTPGTFHCLIATHEPSPFYPSTVAAVLLLETFFMGRLFDDLPSADQA